MGHVVCKNCGHWREDGTARTDDGWLAPPCSCGDPAYLERDTGEIVSPWPPRPADHAPFCGCDECVPGEAPICGDKLFNDHGYGDIMECSKPPAHEGDHGYADVDVRDGRPFTCTWPA